MLKRALMFLAILSILLPSFAFADEGMWMLHQIEQLKGELDGLGLELPPEAIWNSDGKCLAKAVVKIGGGTGTFVSDKGLVITNHHVAFGALQKAATAEIDLMKDGFWAKSLAEEIPAKNYMTFVLKGYENATEAVLAGVNKNMKPLERYEKIEANEKALVAACEAKGDLRCETYRAFDGLEYYLITYFLIRDVRVVYAPPGSIGNYGGDIDNWMWPRHTGDFAFLRAYVAADGSSAEYAEDNVPYKPENHVAISSKGYGEGDFAMIMGYPYRTRRYRSSFSSAETLEFQLPWRRTNMNALIKIMETAGEKDEQARVALAGRRMGLANYYKNTVGTLEGLEKVDLIAVKEKEEAQALAALSGKDKREFAKALKGLDRLFAEHKQFREQYLTADWMGWFCLPIRWAQTIEEWSTEKAKPDSERKPGYQERDIPIMKNRLENDQRDLHLPTEKAVFKHFIELALKLPEGQRIAAIDQALEAGPDSYPEGPAIDGFINGLFDNTMLTDPEKRAAMFEMDREALLAKNDPLIAFAVKLAPERKVMEDKNKAFDGEISRLRPEFIRGLLAGKTGPAYPDANYSMRYSYATVKGFSPKDAVNYHWQTTLAGVFDKYTGEQPFDLPEQLVELRKTDKSIDKVPVDFLSTNDGTGGNSGSSVLNAKGELIGLIFDTNYEAVCSDYFYDSSLSRSINVDVRYILFLMDKVFDVRNVVDEMTIH
jgi:peptidase S46-like protein